MGKVKNHLENIAEQVKFVEHAAEIMRNGDAQIVMTQEHCEMLQQICTNLKMIQSWLMLPDYHQAALNILDGSYQLQKKNNDDKLQFNSAFDVLVCILGLVRKINTGQTPQQDKDNLLWVAQMAMIGVARFVVPDKTGKEARRG